MKAVGLRKAYGGQNILRGVDIELSSSYVTVVKGYSGCGKTTLLRCLCLLENPDEGKLEKDGKDYFAQQRGFDYEGYYRNLSVVFQQLFLWPHLTCYQNALMVAVQSVEVDELFSELEIEAIKYNYPNQVSLGQKQRVALVRALVTQPKYLFLDEVTSALDDHYMGVVARILNRSRQAGTTILAITHDSDFHALIDQNKIVQMEGGQLYEK